MQSAAAAARAKPTVSSPTANRAGTATIFMPTASALLMTEQALTALTVAAPSTSAANASVIASADSTMTEGNSHHGAAIIVTERGLIALADAVRSNSAANASAIAADSTMTEGNSHHGAAIIVRVSHVNGCFWLSSSIC